MASLIYSFIMLAIQSSTARQGPPPPNQNLGPQFPIDENIWVLVTVGILLGIYVVYRRAQSTNKVS